MLQVNSPSIINYFSQGISVQVFFQGFFVFNAIALILALLFYVSDSKHRSNETFLKYYARFVGERLWAFYFPFGNKESVKQVEETTPGPQITDKVKDGIDKIVARLTAVTQFISITSIIIILSFSFGILVNNISDTFMDKQDVYHLGLKRNWAGLDKRETVDAGGYLNTDEAIKIQMFDNVFGHLKLDSLTTTKEFKKQLYYATKHKILENGKWRDYLIYSQNIVNLCQSICFASWLILVFSWIAFFITVTKPAKLTLYKSLLSNTSKGKRQSILTELIMNLLMLAYCPLLIVLPNYFPGLQIHIYQGLPIVICVLLVIFISKGLIKSNRLITTMVFIIIGMIGYHVSAIAWKNAEIETCAKTYRLSKHLSESLKDIELNQLIKAVKQVP